jgi:glutathione S-transferase
MRRILAQRPFLAGERPAYVDYVVYGALMWYRLSVGSALIDAKHSSRRKNRVFEICPRAYGWCSTLTLLSTALRSM